MIRSVTVLILLAFAAQAHVKEQEILQDALVDRALIESHLRQSDFDQTTNLKSAETKEARVQHVEHVRDGFASGGLVSVVGGFAGLVGGLFGGAIGIAAGVLLGVLGSWGARRALSKINYWTSIDAGMGSSEWIDNDTSQPVEVWWQLMGGRRPADGFLDEIVEPDHSLGPSRFALDFEHQVCVKFRDPGNMDQEKIVCQKKSSPSERGDHITYKVSDIIGKRSIAPYNLAALPSVFLLERGANHIDHLVPSLFVLAFLLGSTVTRLGGDKSFAAVLRLRSDALTTTKKPLLAA